MSRGVLIASIVLHAGLAAALMSIDPPVRHELVRIVVRDLRAEPPAPPPPEPEPEPEVVAPEVPPAPSVPSPPRPHRSDVAPPPETAPSEPASDAPPPVDVPDYGIALAGSASGGPGVAVPVGDPGGAPRAPGERRVRTERRALEPAAPSPTDPGCTEDEVRPRALSMPPPRYTDAARAAGLEGRVRVEIHVDAEGRVTDVRVLASLDPDLDAAALEAARGATFAPATRCGRAVEATFTVSIRFTL